MKIAVVGASGFVGSRLVPALQSAGHDVVALTRRPDDYRGLGSPVFADLDDPGSIEAALTGVDAVYFLAHSLGTSGFNEREGSHGETLATAAETAGLDQIIFLGGLGRDDDDLSTHLRSRREVESILAAGKTPVTVLRAGILIGSGSASWEILRQTVDLLPVLIADPRARTRHQPIAADDAVSYLVDVLGREDCRGKTFEIGGNDVLSYREMIERLAKVTGQVRPVFEVPWLPNAVVAAGIELLTDVDGRQALDLLESMPNEAVVTDDEVLEVLPRTLLGFDDAARRALDEPSLT